MTAKSVENILHWIHNSLDKKDCKKWLFRGQSHDWPLKAGIFRDNTRRKPNGTNKPYTRTEDLQDEKRMLEIFKKRSRPYLNYEPKNDLEWLAIAQHHGMPTRLLDWTSNALIAAYNACEHMGSPMDDRSQTREFNGDTYVRLNMREPVIHAIQAPKEAPEGLNPFAISDKKIRLYIPPVISPRIAAQGAFFTIQNEEFDFKENNTTEKLFIQPRDEGFWAESRIKDELTYMGIDNHALYPDIDGLTKSLHWKYKWGKPIY